MSYLPARIATSGSLDDILTPGTKMVLGMLAIVGASKLVGIDPFRPIWSQKRSRR